MFRHRKLSEPSRRPSAAFLLYLASWSVESGNFPVAESTAFQDNPLDQSTEKVCDSEASQRPPFSQLVELYDQIAQCPAQRTHERHYGKDWSNYTDDGPPLQAEDAESNATTCQPAAVSQIVSSYETAPQVTDESFPCAGALEWDGAPIDVAALQMTVESFPYAGTLEWDGTTNDVTALQITAESIPYTYALQWDGAPSDAAAPQMTAESFPCAGAFQWDGAPSDAVAPQMSAESFPYTGASQWGAAPSHVAALQMTADSFPCAGDLQWDGEASDAAAPQMTAESFPRAGALQWEGAPSDLAAPQMTAESFPYAGALQWDGAPSDAAAPQMTAESFPCADASQWGAAPSHVAALQMLAESFPCAGALQWDGAPSGVAALQMLAQSFPCAGALQGDGAPSDVAAPQMTAKSFPRAGALQWEGAPSDAAAPQLTAESFPYAGALQWDGALSTAVAQQAICPKSQIVSFYESGSQLRTESLPCASTLQLNGALSDAAAVRPTAVPQYVPFPKPPLVSPFAVLPQVTAESSAAIFDESTTPFLTSTMKRKATPHSPRMGNRKHLTVPRTNLSSCTPSLMVESDATSSVTNQSGNGGNSLMMKSERHQFILNVLLTRLPESRATVAKAVGRMLRRLDDSPPWLDSRKLDDRLRKWAGEKNDSWDFREAEFYTDVCGVSPFMERWLEYCSSVRTVADLLKGGRTRTDWNIYKITATLQDADRKVFTDLQRAVAKVFEGKGWDKTTGRLYCFWVMSFFAEKLVRLFSLPSPRGDYADSAEKKLDCFRLVKTIVTNYGFKVPHCRSLDCKKELCKDVNYWSDIQGTADFSAQSFYMRAFQELLPPHIAKAMRAKDATGEYQHRKLKLALTSWLKKNHPSADIDDAISKVSSQAGEPPPLKDRHLLRFRRRSRAGKQSRPVVNPSLLQKLRSNHDAH